MTEEEWRSRADFDLPSISAPAMQDPAASHCCAAACRGARARLAVIQYRADNLRIFPIYGPAASA